MAQTTVIVMAIQESILEPLKGFADMLRRALTEAPGGDLLSTLQEDCRAERQLAWQLRTHGLSMPNDLFRETLTKIAAETEQHGQLLADSIQLLGGTLPAGGALGPKAPSSIWQLIAADIAQLGAASARYHEQLAWITNPQIRRLLGQIRDGKQRHRNILLDLLGRTDSYTQPEHDKQGHA